MSAPSVLVTGASRGIGRGIAVSLARRGYGLTVSARSEPDLVALAGELAELGAPEVVVYPVDIADRDALPGLVQRHDTVFGSMRALVLNAGVGTAGTLDEFPLRRLDKMVEVNLTSAVVLIQQAIPLLRRGAQEDISRGARIIGISSITGAYAEKGLAVYGASKAALLSLLETVTLEEAPNGIVATGIAPGYVDTDMSAWIKDTIPAETMIQVDDVVAVVNMVLDLSVNTAVGRIVMTRSRSSGYEA